MTDRELMQQALEALVSSTGELHLHLASPTDMQLIKNHKAIAALRERLAREEPMPMARTLTDELMDCVDRLGSEADLVDPRVWDHLLVYAPKPAQPEPGTWREVTYDQLMEEVRNRGYEIRDAKITVPQPKQQCAHGIGEKK